MAQQVGVGATGSTFDVRVHATGVRKGTRGTTYTVRWVVAGTKQQRTFATAKLADGFRSSLLVAQRYGEAFDTQTGLPIAVGQERSAESWLEHAERYVVTKWPGISPHHRKGIAETLSGVTITLLPDKAGRPDDALIRPLLYRRTFNPANQSEMSADDLRVDSWVRRNSPPLSALSDVTRLREVLDALATRLDGGRAATATSGRKRAVLHGCLQNAVERGQFTSNPLQQVPRKRARRGGVVDRRVVVNPDQARTLLGAARELEPELEAFFACLYWAGLRPSEARNLRLADCELPASGWGTLLLSGSFNSVGPAWTDLGKPGEERELKHRDPGDSRPVPAHPELVDVLRRHCNSHALGPDGRLFVNRRGRAGVPLQPPYLNPVSESTLYRAWHHARRAAFSPPQLDSPLARRPYDLRHACLSTWLNAGVAPVQVAEWAGHTVAVLLQVYSKCIDGETETYKKRIEAATSRPPAGD
jgi:integrase